MLEVIKDAANNRLEVTRVPPVYRGTDMVKKWLTSKTTVRRCERKHLVEDERLGPTPVPFGFQQQEWIDFKRQIQKGDELWEFCSPSKTWEHFSGRAGICIVRNGRIIDSMVTMMN